jgi:hypothetical protein
MHDTLVAADRQLDRLRAEHRRLEDLRAAALYVYEQAVNNFIDDPDGAVQDRQGERVDALDDLLFDLNSEIEREEAIAARAVDRSLRAY